MNIQQTLLSPYNSAPYKVNYEERYLLAVPMVTSSAKGVASFNSVQFSVANGVVSLKYSISVNATADTLVLRDANGHVKVAAPSADGDAVNKGTLDSSLSSTVVSVKAWVEGKGYVTQTWVEGKNYATVAYVDSKWAGFATVAYVDTAVGTKLSKVETTSEHPRAYVADTDGSQEMFEIDGDTYGSIPLRADSGKLYSPEISTNDTEYVLTPKGYVDGRIEDIEALIPSEATSGNKLADKSYVANAVAGKQDSESFEDYESLVEFLNGETSAKYNVGQSIYIGETDVPDVWIYGIIEPKETYTYTTDANFISEILTSGGQCGFYEIRPLETEKTDISTKLDKVTTPTSKSQVYVKNANGSQGVSNLDNGPSGYSIPLRGGSGNFKVGTPTHAQECANKQYVDDAIAGGGGGGFSGYDVIISTDSELNAVLTADGNGGATFNNSTAKAIAIVGTVKTAYRYIVFPTTLLRIDGYKDAQIWVADTDLTPPDVETITAAFKYASNINELNPNPYCVNNVTFGAYVDGDRFKYQAIVYGMSHLNNCVVTTDGYNGWDGLNGFHYCSYLTECTCLDLNDDTSKCYESCSCLLFCRGKNTTSNTEVHCRYCSDIIGYVRLYDSFTHYGSGSQWFVNCNFISDMSISVPQAHTITQDWDDYIFYNCTHISNIKLQTVGNPSGSAYNLIAFNTCKYITASHDENFASYSRCYGAYNCTYVDQNQNAAGAITYSGSCKLKVKSS